MMVLTQRPFPSISQLELRVVTIVTRRRLAQDHQLLHGLFPTYTCFESVARGPRQDENHTTTGQDRDYRTAPRLVLTRREE